MEQPPIAPRTLKIRLHGVAKAEHEHERLGKIWFGERIQLLRKHPDLGVPVLNPPQPARVRICKFRGFEVVTERRGIDELYILTIRIPE